MEMTDFTEQEITEFTDIMEKHGVVTSTWSEMQTIAKCMKSYNDKKIKDQKNIENATKWYNKISDAELDEIEKTYKRINSQADKLEVYLLQLNSKK